MLSLVAAVGGYIAWDRFFRERPQPDWVNETPESRFMYGSIGAEQDAGIPYWIFYVLPRMFPEKLPGPGGYASFGVVWEPGKELPVGFSKKTIGFPRVANKRSACHAATYRTSPDSNPVVVPTGPSHTLDLEAFFRFLIDCAKDPRFNPDMGLERKGLVEEPLIGYVAPFLDGIWLRAPYLHNGSVPTIRDLLEPAAKRPRLFWRGYDLYDPVKVGFVHQGEAAQRTGSKYDTRERSNGNAGHEFGTGLAEEEKTALVEYLKTL